MDESFDPYYKWLAIPPAEQPPNHYRLLGVALFESNADVIASASDRQMGHLRTYQNGPYSALSQQLLNEVAQARITLLQPQSKAQYDERLRQQYSAGHAPPAHRPLRTAQALPTARPLVSPGHAPPAQLHPQSHPAAHPAPAPARPHPQPSAAPAPRAMPAAAHALPATHATPAAQPMPAAQPRAGKTDEAPAPRPRRQQASAVKQIVGIVLGGIAGCYIGAVILNILGAPIPGVVRFLPGLGNKVAKANPGKPEQEPVGENRGENENVVKPDRKPTPQTQNAGVLPANINPFERPNPSEVPLDLQAGIWELKYRETGSNANFDVTRGSNPVKSLLLSDCFVRQNTVRHNYYEPWQSHYFDSAGTGPALIVLPLKAAPGQVFDGKVEVNLMGWVSKFPSKQSIDVAVYRDFDLFRMAPASSPAGKIELTHPTDMQDTPPRPLQLACMAAQWKQMFVVISLASTSSGSARWVLQPQTSIRFRVAPEAALVNNPPITTPVTNNGNPTTPLPLGPSENANLNLQPRYPKNKRSLLPPEEFENLITNWRSGFSTNRPHEWFEKADVEKGQTDRQALFMIGLREAQANGDLQLVGFAFQKLEAETQDDLTPLKKQTLESMYAARQPLFSPVLFAAISVDVLEKLNQSASPGDSKQLLNMALIAAQEAGDRDLQRKLALLAAQTNP